MPRDKIWRHCRPPGTGPVTVSTAELDEILRYERIVSMLLCVICFGCGILVGMGGCGCP